MLYFQGGLKHNVTVEKCNVYGPFKSYKDFKYTYIYIA